MRHWNSLDISISSPGKLSFHGVSTKFIELMIHYCQEDLVVIEFTGQGPSTRIESKSKALAEDFDSFLVQGPQPVNAITTKSD